ncbi:hypothetical protein Tco_0265795, partial [Tanacetum coccineum]
MSLRLYVAAACYDYYTKAPVTFTAKLEEADGSTLGSFGQGGGDFLEEGVTCNTNIKQCLRKVADRDGLRAQHILDALYGEGSATATNLLKFVASAPLTPLLKPDNGIRPIAVGTIWRRFVSKVSMKVAMLTVDFSNAFKLVDRSALLHDQVNLLGPLLFALILHLLLHKIKDSCKLILHAWYLNDGTVLETQKRLPGVDFRKVMSVIQLHEGLFPDDIRRPSSGAKLVGGAVSRDADFISGLAIASIKNVVDLMGLLPQLHDPQSELLLLRSCMGIAKLFFGLKTCQPVHMEDMALFFDKSLRGSIENIVVCGGPFFGNLQWRLASLPIRFGGLGLYSAKLVSSYAFVASRAQSWVLQDHILCNSGICVMDNDYVSALDCLCDTIPSFDFSSFTNKNPVPSKSQQTLENVLFSEMVKDMEVHFDMTMRQKIVF